MKVYINQKQSGKVETIDQFDTRKEARKNLKEYQIAFNASNLYLSTRCTKDWKASN